LYLIQVAYPDVVEAVQDADILLFILPHQFVERACNAIKSHVKQTAFAVSFSKVCFLFIYKTKILSFDISYRVFMLVKTNVLNFFQLS
jgi:glycerol-3-phosphate dehydrogenase (NAD+)